MGRFRTLAWVAELVAIFFLFWSSATHRNLLRWKPKSVRVPTSFGKTASERLSSTRAQIGTSIVPPCLRFNTVFLNGSSAMASIGLLSARAWRRSLDLP